MDQNPKKGVVLNVSVVAFVPQPGSQPQGMDMDGLELLSNEAHRLATMVCGFPWIPSELINCESQCINFGLFSYLSW
jgi:hypothetical protein